MHIIQCKLQLLRWPTYSSRHSYAQPLTTGLTAETPTWQHALKGTVTTPMPRFHLKRKALLSCFYPSNRTTIELISGSPASNSRPTASLAHWHPQVCTCVCSYAYVCAHLCMNNTTDANRLYERICATYAISRRIPTHVNKQQPATTTKQRRRHTRVATCYQNPTQPAAKRSIPAGDLHYANGYIPASKSPAECCSCDTNEDPRLHHSLGFIRTSPALPADAPTTWQACSIMPLLRT